MSPRLTSDRTRVAVEQAIARGDGVLTICRQEHCNEQQVVAIWLRMELLNYSDEDHARPHQSGRRDSRVDEHGTLRGYSQHRADHSLLCDPCRDVKNTDTRRRNADQKASA